MLKNEVALMANYVVLKAALFIRFLSKWNVNVEDKK